MLSAEQLDKIEQDAAKATPGPWKAVNYGTDHPIAGHMDWWLVDTSKARADIYMSEGDVTPNRGVSSMERDEFDMKHVANCAPPTIMELVKMARLGLLVREKFTSGNSVPVDRIGIKRDEYEAIKEQRG